MRDVSLNHLQTFYLVAKHGSYSAAARQLNISYQAAANQIRRLEQILAERLVVSAQGTRAVSLTSRGKSLYRLLAPELDIMLERLAEVVERQRPVLRIGLPQSVLYHLLPYAVTRFSAEYPEVRLQIVERDSVLAELLADGSLDVAIGERFFGEPSITQHPIGAYHLSLIRPARWAAPAGLAEIPGWAAERPFITYEPGQPLRTIALDYLARDGRMPEVAISVSSTSCIQRFVAEGLGFSIVPSWTVDPGAAELGSMPLTDLSEIKLYFCQMQFLADNPYVTAFREACATMLEDRLAAMAGAGAPGGDADRAPVVPVADP